VEPPGERGRGVEFVGRKGEGGVGRREKGEVWVKEDEGAVHSNCSRL